MRSESSDGVGGGDVGGRPQHVVHVVHVVGGQGWWCWRGLTLLLLTDAQVSEVDALESCLSLHLLQSSRGSSSCWRQRIEQTNQSLVILHGCNCLVKNWLICFYF